MTDFKNNCKGKIESKKLGPQEFEASKSRPILYGQYIASNYCNCILPAHDAYNVCVAIYYSYKTIRAAVCYNYFCHFFYYIIYMYFFVYVKLFQRGIYITYMHSKKYISHL